MALAGSVGALVICTALFVVWLNGPADVSRVALLAVSSVMAVSSFVLATHSDAVVLQVLTGGLAAVLFLYTLGKSWVVIRNGSARG